MQSNEKKRRRIIDFFEGQLLVLSDIKESKDIRIDTNTLSTCIYEIQVGLRDMNEHFYFSLKMLVCKLLDRVKIVTKFERPTDEREGILVFHDAIIICGQGVTIEEYKVKLKGILEDIKACDDFLRNTARL